MQIPFQALEPLDALGAAVGAEPGHLLALREDRIGIGGGGNKIRKAEYAIARAVAIAAARYGLECVLVLEGTAPIQRLGNTLLEDLAGASIQWSGGEYPGRLAEELAAANAARLIPFGGSDRDAVAVYTEVGADLLTRVPHVDHVVMAVGSGATAAGLIRGLGSNRVHCVDTGAVEDPDAVLRHLLGDEHVHLRLNRSQVGAGYEHLRPSVLDVLQLFLRSEGILLDATYTGRAAAALVEQYNTGQFAPDDLVVFVHTGGVPGLFGHPALVRKHPLPH